MASETLTGLYRVIKTIPTSKHVGSSEKGCLLAIKPTYRSELVHLKSCYLLKKDDEVERLKDKMALLQLKNTQLRIKKDERKKKIKELTMMLAVQNEKVKDLLTLENFISFLKLGMFASLWFCALLLSDERGP